MNGVVTVPVWLIVVAGLTWLAFQAGWIVFAVLGVLYLLWVAVVLMMSCLLWILSVVPGPDRDELRRWRDLERREQERVNR
ncbi:MAG: hypothetical protein ACR2RB_02235 [Gammaproteobacteria bacterium]